MRQVIALVEQTEAGESLLETETSVPENPDAPHVTTRETFSKGSHVGDTPKARAAQVGSNDPMEYPILEVPNNGLGLKAYGPQTYVGTESITVPGGAFPARKYVLRSPDGAVSTLWLDEHLWPIGIVKLETLPPPSQSLAEANFMELRASGKGARPKIVKPLSPYDADAYRNQQMVGLGRPPTQNPPN
jgi:hypothetical protein